MIPQFGVDPDIYRPLPRVPHAGFTLGYYGRLVSEKGVDTLIEALALLPAEVTAIIVGSGDAGEPLQQLVNERGLRDRVTFRDPIPAEQIPAFLASVDAVVVPSRTRSNWKEQFGRVLVEAMACEVPGDRLRLRRDPQRHRRRWSRLPGRRCRRTRRPRPPAARDPKLSVSVSPRQAGHAYWHTTRSPRSHRRRTMCISGLRESERVHGGSPSPPGPLSQSWERG